ncbi:MAG: hypothetical protein PW792_15265 [Acidobacteriaceae bacterium]|nr:hypothetical protein [Acidobacteriaceae bacterium]
MKRRHYTLAAVGLAAFAGAAGHAQNPSPPLPQQSMPALSPAPTERSVPQGPDASAAPNAQAKEPDVTPLAAPVKTPDAPSPQVTAISNSTTLPARDNAHGLEPKFLGFLGPYRTPEVPTLFAGDGGRLQSLIRNGKLYLTLDDAIDLALENNLDVETERYNLVLGRTDEVRAKGGGSLRGIEYTVNETPAGVGGPGSPLLNAQTANTNPTTPTVTDLTSLNSLTQTSKSLALTTNAYSTGANVPLFDPQLIGTAGWFRRDNTVTLTGGTTSSTSSSSSTTSTGTSSTSPGALDFTALNLAYVEGFATGGQLTAIGNNDAQAIYGSQSQGNPFSRPSTSVTFTQPLLRGFGPKVSLRYVTHRADEPQDLTAGV